MPNDHTLPTGSEYALKVCARLRAFRIESGLEASDVAEQLTIPTDLYLLYEKHELVPHQIVPPLSILLNLTSWH